MGLDWRLVVLGTLTAATGAAVAAMPAGPRATAIAYGYAVVLLVAIVAALRTTSRPLMTARPCGLVLSGGALMLGLWHAGTGDPRLLPATLLTIAIPLAVILAGSALRLMALLSLGPWYVPAVAIQAGQQLVRDGPYRYSRHPEYVSLWLTMPSAAVLTGSLPAIALATIFITAFVARRVRHEEAALALAFGDEWRTYAARTPRWVGFAAAPAPATDGPGR